MMSACRECGSRENLKKDKRDNAILCERCFQYRLLKEGVSEQLKEAQYMMRLLTQHYPKNVDKQKNLLMAIYEMIDNAEPCTYKGHKTVSISQKRIVEIAKKWHVEDAVLVEMGKAMLTSMLPDHFGIAG